jgi:tRNA pseudouridine55 synthase
MGRRKKGSPIHGWIILDKPKGITSTLAVTKVRRLFDAQKAGHAGTLDPMATGVLAVALGEATKTVPFVMDGEKLYRFTVRWGEATDTDDADGKTIETSPVRPDRGAIEATLPRFTGELMQTPPQYSAIKVEGERAYDIAREGQEVTLEPRAIFIREVRLIEAPQADHATFEMACGKGSYVRAWARDFARALGTCGHVSALRRLRVGPFIEDSAISLDFLESLGNGGAALEHLRPLATALDDIPALAVTEPDAVRLRSGNAVMIRAPHFQRLQQGTDPDGNVQGRAVFLHTAKGEPIALAHVADGEMRPFRVFNFGAGP